MFKRLRLQKFKSWQSLANGDGGPGIELSNVSLFLGTNSSGKTSLLQPFLLLKQTAESPDRSLGLNLGGQPTDILNLGRYEDVVFQHEAAGEIGIGLDFSYYDDVKRKSRNVTYDVRYGLDSRSTPVVRCLTYKDGEEVYSVARQAKGGYLLDAPDYAARLRAGTGDPDAKRTYEPERSIAFSAEAIAALGMAGVRVQDLSLKLTRELQNIQYLGPLREEPARFYQWNRQMPSTLGKTGKWAIHALLAAANRNDDKLVAGVSHWLKRMEIADELIAARLGDSPHYEILVRKGNTRANLVDVGFGVSQILPVLVLAYFAPRGATVLIEQPEIHLHPLAQAVLADLFVEVAHERKIQFLIETHSEHLFRRLQYLVAEQTAQPEDCRLYFVEQVAQESTVRRLRMNEFGQVAEWPDRFFGDAIGETERQTEKMLERMLKAEASRG